MFVLRYCCFRWLVYDRALVFEPSRPLACNMMLVWLTLLLDCVVISSHESLILIVHVCVHDYCTVKSGVSQHGNYCQASFHHAHMIHIRYFDNLICGWIDAWVLPFLGQASHLWLTPLASIRNYERRIKVNLTIAWNIWIQIIPLRSNT